MAELSSVDYVFLAILKVEDREISNLELDETYGFRLVGAPLKRLRGAGFVLTDKRGSLYWHQLSKTGDKELAQPWGLDDDHPAKGEGRTARDRMHWAGMVALQNVLSARPAAVVTVGAPSPAVAETGDLDGRIRSAYGKLASAPGAWVALTALRGQLAEVPKADLDQALKAMLRDDEVRLEPEPFGHRVGDAERLAAVHIGGEDRHKLAIGER